MSSEIASADGPVLVPFPPPPDVAIDPKAAFVAAAVADFNTRPEARDEALASVLYYQQSLWEQLGRFQGMLDELGPGGIMKLLLGRGGK